MTKNKKLNIALYVIIAVLVVSALLPIFINLGRKDKYKTDSVVVTDTELNIVDYSVEFEQNTYSINLLSGEIKTNVKVNNVFINVNGHGCEDLSYTQTLNTDGYYTIKIDPRTCILGCAFADDGKITADIYVEYADRSHKVVSKNVDVKGCWTPAYSINFDPTWLV